LRRAASPPPRGARGNRIRCDACPTSRPPVPRWARPRCPCPARLTFLPCRRGCDRRLCRRRLQLLLPRHRLSLLPRGQLFGLVRLSGGEVHALLGMASGLVAEHADLFGLVHGSPLDGVKRDDGPLEGAARASAASLYNHVELVIRAVEAGGCR